MTTEPRPLASLALSLALGASLLACGPAGRSESGEEHAHAAETAHTDEHDHEGHDHDAHDHDAHEAEGEEGRHEEGRVTLAPAMLASAGVVVEAAGRQALDLTVDLPGEIVPNADRIAHIVPRFPGIAKEVRKSLGDHVEQGEVLAILESNESLAPYEVRSLISGTVIEKHITLGEFVRDDSDIYVVADLSTVWVHISVYARDLPRVSVGARVEVIAVGGAPSAEGRIDYIAPALGEATRAALARVVLANASRSWRPGMFVTARVVADQADASVAVRNGSVLRFEGREVVFVEDDGAFVPRPVTPGRADGVWIEILEGLAVGERYAGRGGFILKSELMKSEAGHQH